MTPRGKTPKLGASVFAAAIAFSIGFCTGAPGAYAGETVATEPSGDFIPGSDRASTRPPATFFTINAVLAKLDRQRGRGPGALRTASLTPSNIATDAAPPVQEAPTVGAEPFGLFTFRAPDGILWRKWRGIESDITKEQAVLDHCREGAGAEACPSYAAQFLRVIKAVKAKSGRDQLDEANRAVNMAIRYMSDYAQHGEADRWSAPLASFATGKGDCEDYAIAKFVALNEAGFPRDDLRLVLARDRSVRQDHAVLAARLDGHWLILDSRRSDLINDSEVTNLTPLYAINHRGVQLLAAPLAKLAPLDGDVDPAPAASSGSDVGEWNGQDAMNYGADYVSTLPLLM
jgi:predicted transglutaminase-like cysteine proteinase